MYKNDKNANITHFQLWSVTSEHNRYNNEYLIFPGSVILFFFRQSVVFVFLIYLPAIS